MKSKLMEILDAILEVLKDILKELIKLNQLISLKKKD